MPNHTTGFLKHLDFHFCSYHCINLPETSLHTEKKIDKIVLKSSEIY